MTLRNDLKNLSKSNSDSVGVAEGFAGHEISHYSSLMVDFKGGSK